MITVLLIYEELIPSVRLCALEQLKELERKGFVRLFYSKPNAVTQEMCQKSEVVFFVRASLEIEKLLAIELKKRNKKLVYILDDDILNIPEESISYPYYSRQLTQNRIKEIMSLCHTLVSPSPLLVKKYGQNFLDTFLIEEPCVEHPLKKQKENEIIKIGFAGSMDRKTDFNHNLEQAISTIIEKYKNTIKVEFVGGKPEFINDMPITYIPYMDSYEEYRSFMKTANWDIGLAPMIDDEFHQCKHYNKFIEYGSYSIIGVYSCVFPYTRIIKNKINGILCSNSVDSWVEGLSYLIDNYGERKKMLNNINEQINNDFAIENVSKIFKYIIKNNIKTSFKSSKKINLKYLKLLALITRSCELIKLYTWKAPYIVLKKIYKS